MVLQGRHELLLLALRLRFGVEGLVVIHRRDGPQLGISDDRVALLFSCEEVARHLERARRGRAGRFRGYSLAVAFALALVDGEPSRAARDKFAVVSTPGLFRLPSRCLYQALRARGVLWLLFVC